MVKVGYVSPVDPNTDRMTWSGTFYNTFHAIQNAGVEVRWIPSASPQLLYKGMTKGASLIYKLKYGKGYPAFSKLMSSTHNLFVNKKLIKGCDLLFVPGQADIVAGLNCDTPIIYYSDATFKKMINYYWFDFSSKAIQEGNRIERLAIEKATYNFRSSHWAAQSTIHDYGADEKNTYVYPFGADVPKNIKGAAIPDYKQNKLKLLFSGKDWNRKGGDLAVDAAEYLNTIGIKTELYIVGIKQLPPKVKNKNFIRLIGYIDKNSSEDYKRYLNLYYKCNALILPTRAECSALVFSEANAFGMPIFSTDTGGVGDYVLNGRNGYRLPLKATGVDFGKCIEKVWKEKKFRQLSLGSKKIYEESTSWQAWTTHFKKFIEYNYVK